MADRSWATQGRAGARSPQETEVSRARVTPVQARALGLQRLVGNRAVTGLLRGASGPPVVVQREFVDGGQAAEATIEPAAGEVAQPDLGETAVAAQPVAETVNEFGEMDGAIDTGVAPHTFVNKGQVSRGTWHHCGGSGGVGLQGVGSATLVAPVYDSKPAKKAGGQATAKVRKGTGKVKVTRSYTGVTPGDNGNATWTGAAGAVYIKSSGTARMATHERGHVKESKRFHDASLKPLEKRVTKTEKAATEAEAITALQTHVDWNTSINAFATADTTANTPGGTWDTSDQSKANFYHDKGPKTIKKKNYAHLIEAP